jgi:hypothetical protein
MLQQLSTTTGEPGLLHRFVASLAEKQYYQHWWGGKRTTTTFSFDASALTRAEVTEHAAWLLSTKADEWSEQDVADAQARVVTVEMGLVGKFVASLSEKQYYQHWWGGKRTTTTFSFDASTLTRAEVTEHAAWLLSTKADEWSEQDVADAQVLVVTVEMGLVSKFVASLAEKQYYQHWYGGKRTTTTFSFDASALTRAEVTEHAAWLLSTKADEWSEQDVADAQARVVTVEMGLVNKFVASLSEKQYYQHWYGGKRTTTTFSFDASTLTRAEVTEHAAWLLSTKADEWSEQDVADAQVLVVTVEMGLVDKFLTLLAEKQYYQHWYGGKRTTTTFSFDASTLTRAEVAEHAAWLLSTKADEWSEQDVADAQVSINVRDPVVECDCKASEDPIVTSTTDNATMARIRLVAPHMLPTAAPTVAPSKQMATDPSYDSPRGVMGFASPPGQN